MQRFFFSKSKESQPFLTEINVEDPLAPKGSISAPYHSTNHTHRSVDEALYEKTQLCLSLLNEAKENLTSRHVMEEKWQNFLLVWIPVCSLGSLLTSGTLMYKMHEDLAAIVLRKLKPLIKQATPIAQEYNEFMNWYNKKISSLNNVILNQYFDCEREVGGSESREEVDFFWSDACPGKKTVGGEIPGTDYDWFRYDFCAMSQTKYPVAKCNQILDKFCATDTRILNCTNETIQNKNEFVSEQAPHMSALTDKFQSAMAPINALAAQSTWEPYSTTGFALTGAMGMSLVIYLYKSWRNAQREYQEDLKEIQINPQDLPLLINLATTLKISLQEMSHDQLVAKLEMTAALEKPRKEARIAFFKAAHRHGLPQEVSKIILEQAEMIARPAF